MGILAKSTRACYFYISAVPQGNSLHLLKVKRYSRLKSQHLISSFTRVGVQVLDRKDGSFIVRYRMYASYRNLKIEVKHHGQHVAKSPYILRGILKQNFTIGFVHKNACHSINE